MCAYGISTITAHHRCGANRDPRCTTQCLYSAVWVYVRFSHCLFENDGDAMHSLRFYFLNMTFYLSNSEETKPFRTVCIQTPVVMVTNKMTVVVTKCN